MANPSKQKGTKAETAVVRYLRENGVTDADRIALKGTSDEGDVAFRNATLQVKAGHAAEDASDATIATWLGETATQRHLRDVDLCALVRKRKGKGEQSIGQWWVHLHGWTFVWLAELPLTVLSAEEYRHAHDEEDGTVPAAQITLDQFIGFLRRAQFIDPA